MRARGTLPFYIGGFLGPFGGGVVAVLVPQLRDAFDATTAGVALSIPAYLVPFARAAARLGDARRAARAGAGSCARATSSTRSCRCAAAFVPTLGAFLVVRALQGCANAFLTPLLLAGLADEVPPRQIGRAVGTFAAVQTSAVALAPLGGGAAGRDRLAAGVRHPGGGRGRARADAARRRRGARASRPRLRTVLTRRVGLLSAASFAGYAGITGVGFLVAVLAADDFGLGSVTRGVLLAGFGVAGIVIGRAAGQLGRPLRAGAGGVRGHRGLRGARRRCWASRRRRSRSGALWFVTGLGSTLVWAGINTLAVEAVPATGRAGRR